MHTFLHGFDSLSPVSFDSVRCTGDKNVIWPVKCLTPAFVECSLKNLWETWPIAYRGVVSGKHAD